MSKVWLAFIFTFDIPFCFISEITKKNCSFSLTYEDENIGGMIYINYIDENIIYIDDMVPFLFL